MVSAEPHFYLTVPSAKIWVDNHGGFVGTLKWSAGIVVALVLLLSAYCVLA